MSKPKPAKRRPPQYVPKERPSARPGLTSRERLRARADEISLQFARMDKYLNRVLLALLLAVAVLWLCKALPALTARYLLIALLGVSLALNGISGYRNSRWAGSFLMLFGTALFLSNLYMLVTQ